MACVATGSLVEICGGFTDGDSVFLTPVESLAKGDWILDPVVGLPRRIVRVHVQFTSGMWSLCHYMGLRADPTQLVQQNGGAWTRIVSAPVPQSCKALYGIVLEGGGGAVRVDGVVCRTHTVEAPALHFNEVCLQFGGSIMSVAPLSHHKSWFCTNGRKPYTGVRKVSCHVCCHPLHAPISRMRGGELAGVG